MNTEYYNPYKVLGINEKSNLDDIKTAYKKLALKYHPDRNINKNNKEETEIKFKEISKAYTLLIKNNGRYNIYNKNLNIDIDELLNKGKIFTNFLKNLKMENITNNIFKELILMSKYYEGNKELPITESLNVNATIELFDIYHNIEKKINITIEKKCGDCLGIGYTLDDKFLKCAGCNGLKIIYKEIELKFNCKYKSICFPNLSNEKDKHNPGNIYVNIIPKDLRGYKIYNNYDLLYIKRINISEIDNGSYSFKLKHFDNNTYSFKVTNIILNKEYIIDSMGLYNPNSNIRNKLIILFLENVIDNYTNITYSII
jgi:DnaJ-class molecular chaperone